jgi:Flp pilus assembly protein TadD
MSSALYRIGWIYNDLEDYDSAVDPLQRVVSIQPNNAAAQFELGYAYKKLERYSEALTAFHQNDQHQA